MPLAAAAAIGAVGSIAGGIISSKAAGKAADAQTAASQAAIDEERRQFDLNRSDLAPYRDFGGNALTAYNALLGIGRTGFIPQTGSGAPVATAAPAPAPAPTPAAPALPETPDPYHLPPDFMRYVTGKGYNYGHLWGEGETNAVPGLFQQLWNEYRATVAPQQSQAPAPAPTPASAPAPATASGTGAPFSSVAEAQDFFGVHPANFSFDPTFKFDPNGFEASPDYAFRKGEGENAITRAAAASGGLNSGARLKAAGRFASDLASGEYGDWYARAYGSAVDDYNRRYGLASDTYSRDYGKYTDYLNRLAAAAGTGQTAATQTAQLGTSSANSIARLTQDQGAARASGYLGQAQATNNALAGVGSAAGFAAAPYVFGGGQSGYYTGGALGGVQFNPLYRM